MAKSAGVPRKSDGGVVLLIAGTNPVLGKARDCGHVEGARKRERMGYGQAASVSLRASRRWGYYPKKTVG